MDPNTEITNGLNPAEWLDRHGDYLYRYAMARVRDAAVAEDLLQETLLAAISASHTHEGRSSERTWLAGIMKHKMFDYFRRVSKTAEQQFAADDDGGGAFDVFENSGAWRGHWREDRAPVSWPVDAVKLLESREFFEVLDRCLSRLPQQMAIAFTLREIDGLSTSEICEILDISPNNLWVILHRGRARLRELLEAEWFRGHRPASPVKDKTPLAVTAGEFPPEFSLCAIAA